MRKVNIINVILALLKYTILQLFGIFAKNI